MEHEAARIECFGDGLKFGYINQPMYATVYTNDARQGSYSIELLKEGNFFNIFLYLFQIRFI